MTSKNLPKDVFLHLLSIATLIAVAVSFGILAFACINLFIPDVVSDYYFSRSGQLSSMRGALATLIIVFPVFLWVSWFIRRDISKSPEKGELKIRKWLLYLTLFISALVIIGDLVVLVRSFLEGELSQRFILKVATILFIAGSIFIHYLSELKEKNSFSWIKPFDWAVVIIVAATIIYGFFVAGSPQNQRLVRFDERRVSDLQTLQWQIINYWQKKSVLPNSLNDVSDPLSGFVVPRDPETGDSYGYNTTGDLRFELCADFDTYNVGDQSNSPAIRKPVPVDGELSYYGNDVWEHDAGHFCFSRLIDPDLYPPVTR